MKRVFHWLTRNYVPVILLAVDPENRRLHALGTGFFD